MKTLLKISMLLGLTITLSLCENKTFSPSFDCSNEMKLNRVEKLICSDEELSKLDNEMAKAYKYMLSISNETSYSYWAYKHMLPVSNETQKQQLISEQRKWLRYRDKTNCWTDWGGKHNDTTSDCLKDVYNDRLFYLQKDEFRLVHEADNQTCKYFTYLLNDNLKKSHSKLLKPEDSPFEDFDFGNNILKTKEFNWVGWKDIGRWSIKISYFDINNDGVDEAVFKTSEGYEYRVDLRYMSKEDGKAIEKLKHDLDIEHEKIRKAKYDEEYNKTMAKYNNSIPTYVLGMLELKNGELKGRQLSNTDFKLGGEILYKSVANLYSETGFFPPDHINLPQGYSIRSPEPHPLLLNDNYYIAVFGTTARIDDRKLIADGLMLEYSNIVMLVKYSPENSMELHCILTRANPKTKSLLNYIRDKSKR
ncbi:MAG: lysozyme inhibitor LprI family protein [Campylobacteraceae bacterium]|jgi:uncharacterized protein|nr:lysozyme inhibitor LprI family protein [Campylobacteraceae bacterium]